MLNMGDILIKEKFENRIRYIERKWYEETPQRRL